MFRALRSVFVVVLVGFGVCAGASAAWALSEGRAYELVSPPYKGGYGVQGNGVDAVSQSGESVAFLSVGAFAGAVSNNIFNVYLARRGSTSWTTVPFEPPSSSAPVGVVVDFNPTLTLGLWMGHLAPNGGTAEYASSESVFFTISVVNGALQYLEVGQPIVPLDQKHAALGYRGTSPEFCDVLFTELTEGQQPFLTEAIGSKAELYELGAGCDSGEPETLRLVAARNKDGSNNEPEVLDRACPDEIGGFVDGGEYSQYDAIADDGNEIFFTGYVEPEEGSNGCGLAAKPVAKNPGQLFMRVAGEKTVEISRPLEPSKPFDGCERNKIAGEVPCAGAATHAPSTFWGASEDGSTVFFTTAQPLVAGDTDTTDNLYMTSVGCPQENEGCDVAERQPTSLVRVSTPPSASEAAEVQGMLKISPDGSHVYFVARGVLVGHPTEGCIESLSAQERLYEENEHKGRCSPLKGADNMYLYDRTSGELEYIADLCSGPGRSGSVEDAHCPSDLEDEGTRSDAFLWNGKHAEAQVNICGLQNTAECVGERETGRYLVFSSYGQLLRNDTDDALDIYRYDSQTGSLSRVSTGEEGEDANGNCADGEEAADPREAICDSRIGHFTESESGSNSPSMAGQRDMGDRAINEDGSRIVFTTAAPLSVYAVNHLDNVYEWHKEASWPEGEVSLVSTGSSTTADSGAVITQSGNDIFFETSQGLVPQDTDGQTDVYDARLNGAFPLGPAEPKLCSGEACYGPLTNPTPLLVPGSVSQAPGGNFVPPAVANVKPKAKKAKKKSKSATAKKNGRKKQKSSKKTSLRSRR